MNDLFGARLFRVIGLAAMLAAFGVPAAHAQEKPADAPLRLEILSSKTLSGTAGDFVTVQAQVTNTGAVSVTDITTYLSLVDEASKLPVDLEDWSAEKGLFIGSIDAGQTLPLSWKIHFVKAGKYSLIIVAATAGREMPQVSTITHFAVAPKHNLDPGRVLPVALGMPILVLIATASIARKRRRHGG